MLALYAGIGISIEIPLDKLFELRNKNIKVTTYLEEILKDTYYTFEVNPFWDNFCDVYLPEETPLVMLYTKYYELRNFLIDNDFILCDEQCSVPTIADIMIIGGGS